METIRTRTSVRGLVEFILRSGDLDNRDAAGAEDAMLEGARIHRMIQQAAGADYRAEVTLRHLWCDPEEDDEAPDGAGPDEAGPDDAAPDDAGTSGGPGDGGYRLEVLVEGRADGVFPGLVPPDDAPDWYAEEMGGDKDGIVFIDEIKSTYRDLARMQGPEPVHLAQAECYAYIYALQNGLPVIGVRMTYCSLDDMEIRHFHSVYRFAELEEMFSGLMAEYRKWAVFRAQWAGTRTASIRETAFPYEYRPGQKELCENVYRTIVHERCLFLEAPTGTGKTLAALFPAVKAMGEGKTEKIFYLTAKTITRTAALGALGTMRRQGLRVKSVLLTAKDKICVLEGGPQCDPESCPRAKGHFDRVNAAIYELLTESDNFDRDEIASCAERHCVCPFELSLDLSLFADAVICDYNYVFDPHVYLRRFFGDGGVKTDFVFLVDEAHNLVERGREMYSAEIARDEWLAFRRRVKAVFPARLEKALSACLKRMLAMKRECPGCTVHGDVDQLTAEIYRLGQVLREIIDSDRKARHKRSAKTSALAAARKEAMPELLEFYFGVLHFLLISERLDEHYVIYTDNTEDRGFVLRLFKVDPSANLRECMDRGRSSILFSATLLPIQYYKSLLGGTEDDYEVYAHSVFDRRRQGTFIVSDVTSRYARRGPEEYARIAEAIHRITAEKFGNYLVFFPSYAFLREVRSAFEERWLDDTTVCAVQKQRMREEEREAFLALFEETTDERRLVAFCVMGGIFSEGIDLTRDRLIGVIVVGTGLPQVCSEREIMKEHFTAAGENGYDYAYRFPGMNKVLQAAGRVIRTQEDVGVVALLDERFRTPQYRRLFPAEWTECTETPTEALGRQVSRFWDQWL